jgi:outer membrane protein OmpA-like peptidoglycan-associated protein
MKQILTTFLLALILLCTMPSVSAQDQLPRHGVTLRSLWYNYTQPNPDIDNLDTIFSVLKGRGIEAAYNYRLDKRTWLVVPLKAGVASLPGANNTVGRKEGIVNLDAIVQTRLFKYGAAVNPNVHLGIGSSWFSDRDNDDAFDFNMPVGLGVDIRVAKDLFVNAQSSHRFSIKSQNGWHHGLGLTYLFGAPPPPDRDGDGVIDANDKCPDVPGILAMMGCPDRDADGITDADDKCPDVAGLPAMMGCPDKDGDGITDADDKCPDQKGLASLKGCPDTDSDGLADGDDKCPREAGPAANGGCPVRDRDGDGIEDKDDACPDAKGTVSTKGCPDRDGDGIADKDDACPDKKGVAAGKGCPDTDGDGIYDNEDRCPEKAGVAALKGCPEIKKEDKAKLERAIKLVQFETGKATLLQKSYAILDEVVSVMNQYSEYSLNISGHTDNQGDDKSNQDLSERRAKACYDYLVSKGIAASRMASAGYGETKPVASNETKQGREQNRRVEFELYVK